MKSAIAYNKKYAIKVPDISSHDTGSLDFALDIKTFQEKNGLEADGKLGPTTLAHIRQYIFNTAPIKTLSQDNYISIAHLVSQFEGNFWSVNRDGEYRGLFDRDGKKHWASGSVHIGLSFGFIQFTQDGGALGLLLKEMKAFDPKKFKEIFGEFSDELITVTNRKGKERVNGRSPRVQAVGGYDLWSDYWVSRFIEAGRHTPFQKAQLKLAVKDYMMPAVKICKELGISSERGLAIVFDRCVQYGPRGAKRLIESANGPKEEHLRLKHLLDEWKGKRWHHRVQKLYMNQTLTDCTCAFE